VCVGEQTVTDRKQQRDIKQTKKPVHPERVHGAAHNVSRHSLLSERSNRVFSWTPTASTGMGARVGMERVHIIIRKKNLQDTEIGGHGAEAMC
jgi:hypothetical protein